MIMKSLILSGIILASIFIYSCDDQTEYDEDKNNTPEIGLLLDGTLLSGTYFDSIKIDKTITLQYYLDHGLSNLCIENNDNIVSVKTNGNNLIFTAKNIGDTKIKLNAKDSLNKTTERELNFNVFKNKLPVCILDLSFTADDTKTTVTVDASKSYDSDKRFGGTIKTFKYVLYELISKEVDGVIINQWEKIKTFENESGTLAQNFINIKAVKYEVQVKDNNGEWSNIVTKTISLQ